MNPLADYRAFEAYLNSFTNYERKRQFRYDSQTVPLERMRSFVEELGSPHRAFPSVHITGSKGKGSTTLILEALLRASGYAVGTYTSPHVEELRERIRCRGESISESDLVRITNEILPILERRSSRPGDFPTFFELMTGLALFHFARERVDHAVIEVGLGGRLDATNVVDAPIVAITSIGLEHTRILGSTLGAIAREKAGIIKDGATVVVGNLPREARAVIGEVARERKARVIDVDPDHVIANADGLRWRGMPWPVAAPSIRGPALRASLALALDLHAEVLAREGRAPDPTAITEALRNLSLPGRVELFEGPPAVLIDGAHTAESFALLAECLPELALPSPRTVIFSIAADKNVEPILDLVRTIGDDFLWTRADPVRSLDPAELQARTGVGTVIEDPKEALEHALERGHSIVVCGSLYLAGTIRSALRSIQRAAEERTAQAS